MSFIQKYGKALVPAAVAVVTAAQAPLTDNSVTTQEVIAFLIAVNATISVYFVPILEYRWVKTAIGVVNAVLMALAVAVIGGLNANDILQLVLAGLMAVGVKAAHSESDPVDGEVADDGGRGNPYTQQPY
jgi:hypothetical protein